VPKQATTKLSVFKGREAKLNRAIFQALALKGPQTIYEVHKQIRFQKGLRRTRYGNVNKRVRILEEASYIKKTGAKKTKAGFEARVYELTSKAYLALMLDFVSLDSVLSEADESIAATILGALVQATDA